MRKIFLFLFIIICLISEGAYLNYSDDITVLNLEKTEYFTEKNDTSTFFRINTDTVFEEKEFIINRGPLKYMKIKDNFIEIYSYVPVEIKESGDKIYFEYTEKGGILDFSGENIKLKDILKLFFENEKLNWVFSTDIPEKNITFYSKKIKFPDIIRITEKVYGLKFDYYGENTVIVSSSEKNFDNNMPYIINTKSEEITDISTETTVTVSENEIKEVKDKKYVYIVLDNKVNIKNISKIFPAEIAETEISYVVKTEEENIGIFTEIYQKLLDVYYENIPETKEEKTEIEIKENVVKEEENKEEKIYYIAESSYNLEKFSEIYGVKIIHISDNKYILFGEEKKIKDILALNIENITYSEPEIINEKTEKIVILPYNVNNIFVKILNSKNINYDIIDRFEEKIVFKINADEEELKYIDESVRIFNTDIYSGNYDLKQLITNTAKKEGINVISKFSKNYSVYVNDENINIERILKLVSFYGIMYNYIDDKTIVFFESDKILKYSVFVLSGDDIDKIGIEDIYFLKYISDENYYFSDKSYIISNPVLYAKENENAVLNSTFSVPVIENSGNKETPDKVIGYIKTGFSLEVSGDYNYGNRTIDSYVKISISELNQALKDGINEKSLTTKIKVFDGGTVKIGSIDIVQLYDKEKGIPFFSDIPLFGSMFRKYEKRENRTKIYFIIKIDSLNYPEI